MATFALTGIGSREPENEKSAWLWAWKVARHNLLYIPGIPCFDCEEVSVRLIGNCRMRGQYKNV